MEKEQKQWMESRGSHPAFWKAAAKESSLSKLTDPAQPPKKGTPGNSSPFSDEARHSPQLDLATLHTLTRGGTALLREKVHQLASATGGAGWKMFMQV